MNITMLDVAVLVVSAVACVLSAVVWIFIDNLLGASLGAFFCGASLVMFLFWLREVTGT